MWNHISANDLKTKGISAIEALFAEKCPEAVITIRGTPKFVVIPIEDFDRYREGELLAAWEETQKDIAEGHYSMNIEKHLLELRKACSK